MNTEDYVSYPLALALKKAGFDWKCDHYYCAFANETDVRFWSIHPAQSQNGLRIPKDTVVADAPTLWQAQKWLREKWDWHIDVFPAADCSLDADGQVCEEWNYWDFDIMHVISTRKIVESEERYDSFEQALSAGIAAALELIEQKGA